MEADILSDVLQNVRLCGAIFFDVSTASPWVAEAPPAAEIAHFVLPDAQHVIEYHVLTRGKAWATLIDSDQETEVLGPGSIIMFPQGDRHVLSSKPRMRADPDLSLFDQDGNASPPFYVQQVGEGPEDTHMICGFIGCDIMPFNPVIQTLPRMMHIPDGYSQGNGWLGNLILAIIAESRQRRSGGRSVLSRLSELLFIEAVRCYKDSLQDKPSGWIAALADERIGMAIRQIHNDPARPWTLNELATETGMSKTLLVNRFTELLGVAPMTYLFNWRMQLAARMLVEKGASIARIAEEVGYDSEAAFSRAFKRSTNVSPGKWRNNRLLRNQRGQSNLI